MKHRSRLLNPAITSMVIQWFIASLLVGLCLLAMRTVNLELLPWLKLHSGHIQGVLLQTLVVFLSIWIWPSLLEWLTIYSKGSLTAFRAMATFNTGVALWSAGFWLFRTPLKEAGLVRWTGYITLVAIFAAMAIGLIIVVTRLVSGKPAFPIHRPSS